MAQGQGQHRQGQGQHRQANMEEMFRRFFDAIMSLPNMGPNRIAQFGAKLPMLGIMQQWEQGNIQNRQLDYQLKVLQQDFKLKGTEELALAKQNLKFQQGPYFEYLKLKTGNDMAISNNEVLTSGEYTKQARQATMQAKQATKQSMNNTLASLQNTKQSRYGADAAKYNYLNTIGRIAGGSGGNDFSGGVY